MSHGHMQMSDGSAMNMNVHHHHADHFENVLNLNMNTDYHHYGTEYWNASYKNGSTPMKEMEGEDVQEFTSVTFTIARMLSINARFKRRCCILKILCYFPRPIR
jgi:hypothetical protein